MLRGVDSERGGVIVRGGVGRCERWADRCERGREGPRGTCDEWGLIVREGGGVGVRGGGGGHRVC